MYKKIAIASLAGSLSLAACTEPTEPDPPAADPEPKTGAPKQARNPFGMEDIAEDFFGDQLQEWAAGVELSGGGDDPNAQAWASPSGQSAFGSIDGEWTGRWSESGKDGQPWMIGSATIRNVGDRVFFHYRSENQGDEYLCETLREGDRLVGTYVNVDPFMSDDNGPWVGLIVGPDRIDGAWFNGRWDFRRVAAEAE